MNLLCWNCPGLGNARAVHMLHHWSSVNNLVLIYVSEMVLSGSVAKNLKRKIGFDCVFGVDSEGSFGDLCVYWKGDKVHFNLVSFSKHHICGDVAFESGLVWRFVRIYGYRKLLKNIRHGT